MWGVTLCLLLCVATAGAWSSDPAAGNSWSVGRATYYGDQPWLWSIHKGSCGFGYIWSDEPLGWDVRGLLSALDVAAIADANPSFGGSCGRCYEVQCDPAQVTDNYDHKFDRTSVCYDAAASVVVRITDACPCNFDANYYSNRRWCCGDMSHFDLSIWAFEKLASTKWGVIGIKYRAVPCDYQPALVAPTPLDPFPGQNPPAGTQRTNRWAADAMVNLRQIQDQIVSSTDLVYQGQASPSWRMVSWFAKPYADPGPNGGTAACAKVFPSGTLAFEASKSRFVGKVTLELWIKGSDGVPDVMVNLSGDQKSCRGVKIQDMTESGRQDGWSRFNLYLGLFASSSSASVVSFTPAFAGCGYTSAKDLDRIEVINNKPFTQDFCVDDVKLVGA